MYYENTIKSTFNIIIHRQKTYSNVIFPYISRYMNQDDPMEYTDFANGETRYTQPDDEQPVLI